MKDLATYYRRLRIAWAQHRRRYPGGPHLDAADRASIRAIWDGVRNDCADLPSAGGGA